MKNLTKHLKTTGWSTSPPCSSSTVKGKWRFRHTDSPKAICSKYKSGYQGTSARSRWSFFVAVRAFPSTSQVEDQRARLGLSLDLPGFTHEQPPPSSFPPPSSKRVAPRLRKFRFQLSLPVFWTFLWLRLFFARWWRRTQGDACAPPYFLGRNKRFGFPTFAGAHI